MKMNKRHTLWALLALAVWVTAGSTQQATGPGQRTPMKIEGTIASLSLAAAPGPPFMLVKNAEGLEYRVHFGPLRMLESQGFSPKVGDAVIVNGFTCPWNPQMIHSNEITLSGKTYATPMAQQQMMQTQPGMGSMSDMRCGAENCPNCSMPESEVNCPNCPMPQEMHHEMHHSMHHR